MCNAIVVLYIVVLYSREKEEYYREKVNWTVKDIIMWASGEAVITEVTKTAREKKHKQTSKKNKI